MPSRFEPCGLSQMMAMRYGTVPIVHETGGLKDSVRPYSDFDGIGDGFSFSNYQGKDLLLAIMSALRVYFCDEETFCLLRRRCMEKDFSWKRSAERYQRMYAEIFDGESGSAVPFEEAFAELKEAYVELDAENRERFHGIFTADYQRVVQIHVTGRTEGVLYVRFSNEEREPFRMEPYSYDGADAYVTANFDHLLAMAKGELSFDKLFLSGQIRVDGNLSKGTEIRNLLCRRE
jgi:putative sterol carrier protein